MPSVAKIRAVTMPFVATLPGGESEPIKGEFYPFRTTPESLAAMMQSIEAKDPGALAQQVAEALASWDLKWTEEDTEPIPLVEAELRRVPIDILAAVSNALQEANSVPKPTNAPSVNVL